MARNRRTTLNLHLGVFCGARCTGTGAINAVGISVASISTSSFGITVVLLSFVRSVASSTTSGSVITVTIIVPEYLELATLNEGKTIDPESASGMFGIMVTTPRTGTTRTNGKVYSSHTS